MSLIQKIASWFGVKPALPEPPQPPPGARRIRLGNEDLKWDSTETIRRILKRPGVGLTIDLEGAILDGREITHPKDKQDENARGITITVRGLRLINGWIIDVPGGLAFKVPGCQIRQLKFMKIGEDAVSTVGPEATGLGIHNCEFWNTRDGDKTIQLNQAKDATIRNCKIVGGITGIRIQKASYKTPGVIVPVDGVEFIGCETGLNLDGHATVRLTRPKFTGVGKKWVFGNKGSGTVVQL